MSMLSGLEMHLEYSFKNSAAVFSSTALASVDSVAVPSVTVDRVLSSFRTARWTAISKTSKGRKEQREQSVSSLFKEYTCQAQYGANIKLTSTSNCQNPALWGVDDR